MTNSRWAHSSPLPAAPPPHEQLCGPTSTLRFASLPSSRTKKLVGPSRCTRNMRVPSPSGGLSMEATAAGALERHGALRA